MLLLIHAFVLVSLYPCTLVPLCLYAFVPLCLCVFVPPRFRICPAYPSFFLSLCVCMANRALPIP